MASKTPSATTNPSNKPQSRNAVQRLPAAPSANNRTKPARISYAPPTSVKHRDSRPGAKPSASSTANKGPVAAQSPRRQPEVAAGGNWLNRYVQDSVAGVGNYAGGFINSIGDSVDRVGEGVGSKINDTTRYWGQGVAGYGNSMKDSVGVAGPRVPTGGNPLGLAGQGSSQNQSSGGRPQAAVRNAGKGGATNPLGLSG